MTCGYITTSRAGEKLYCLHPARSYRVGLGSLILCKCHASRIQKQKRYQRKRLRLGKRTLFRTASLQEAKC